jgi:hypothetical protein
MSKRVVCILPEETTEEILDFIKQKGGRVQSVTNQTPKTVLTGPDVILTLTKTNQALVEYADNVRFVFHRIDDLFVHIVLDNGHKRRTKYYLLVFAWEELQRILQKHVSVETLLMRYKYQSRLVNSYREAASWLEWDWRASDEK